MFRIERTKGFERDVKHYLAKDGDPESLKTALQHLARRESLPPWFRDHALRGKLRKFRELHVEPDWLLVYEKDGKKLRIVCLWLVSHKKLRERERSL
jgi:mRNA interferase YafQ